LYKHTLETQKVALIRALVESKRHSDKLNILEKGEYSVAIK
jgi:hypothetical protein